MIVRKNVKCLGRSLVPVDLVGHDVVKVVGHHKSIIVEVSLVENVVPLVVRKVLAQFLTHLLQLGNSYLPLNQTNNTARLMSNEAHTLSI